MQPSIGFSRPGPGQIPCEADTILCLNKNTIVPMQNVQCPALV
jgi:hypothetical protein